MEPIAIYCNIPGPRHTYVLDWIFRERLQVRYRLITDKAAAAQLPFCIAYGATWPGALSIPASGLLAEEHIDIPAPVTGTWGDVPVLFAESTQGYALPFDLFSAVFYLLSRYEEYASFAPDKHGRYPATASILYRQGWLSRPVVDEWLAALRKLLKPHMADAPPAHFRYLPTYDIDMAYAHLHKGIRRIVGAYMRALMRMDVGQISERTLVLKKKQKDPYDSFRWLRQLHKEYGLHPVYFVLSAARTTAFDKNIHPYHPAMMRVIRNLVRDGATGIHPSYYSDKGDVMGSEKALLESVSGQQISISRQHYIRMRLPGTYRQLLANGITDDYSMGYGSHLGFRAGTGSSFPWFDLQANAVTALRAHPFCFMDTTAHYEARLPVSDAFTQLHHMSATLQRTGSTLVTIFHNFSLGTDAEWKGWKQAYEHFLQDTVKAL